PLKFPPPTFQGWPKPGRNSRIVSPGDLKTGRGVIYDDWVRRRTWVKRWAVGAQNGPKYIEAKAERHQNSSFHRSLGRSSLRAANAHPPAIGALQIYTPHRCEICTTAFVTN